MNKTNINGIVMPSAIIAIILTNGGTVKNQQKPKLPGFLRFHINFVNHIPGNYNILLPSKTCGQLLQLNENPLKVLKKLQIAQFIHIFIRSIQIGFLAYEFKYGRIIINGDKILAVHYFLAIVQIFTIATSFLQNKCNDFVNIINTLFQLPVVKSSILLKFMFFNAPLVSIIVPALYSLISVLIGTDPITIYILLLPCYKYSILLRVLRISL